MTYILEFTRESNNFIIIISTLHAINTNDLNYLNISDSTRIHLKKFSLDWLKICRAEVLFQIIWSYFYIFSSI